MSPGAASFKQEVKDCIARLAAPLAKVVAQEDVTAINKTLALAEPSIKLCRMCPFQMGVVDQVGDIVARFPEKKEGGINFSGYGFFKQVMKSRRIAQQRVFLQDGSEIYIIAAPLLLEGRMVGELGLALDAEDALHRWDLTDKEFLAMDFNN